MPRPWWISRPRQWLPSSRAALGIWLISLGYALTLTLSRFTEGWGGTAVVWAASAVSAYLFTTALFKLRQAVRKETATLLVAELFDGLDEESLGKVFEFLEGESWWSDAE